MSFSRRRAIAAIAAAIVAAPRSGRARDEPGRIRRIGVLSLGPPPAGAASELAEELKRFGYVEGQNLVIERRYATGDSVRLQQMARELAELPVEVIYAAQGNDSTAAAQRATRSIPIVMAYGIAPVEAGFIKSYAHPGGNITGVAYHTPETGAKLFDLLLQAAPKARRAVMLWNPSRPGYHAYRKVLEAIARKRGMTLAFIGIEQPSQVPEALRTLDANPPDLLLVANDFSIREGTPSITEWAKRRRIPSVGTVDRWVEAGGLFYYGPSDDDAVKRAAYYTARILGGARVADLPVEQPLAYQFAINAETARLIGLPIPDSLRMRAQRVVGR
jgi:putative ABC transport system substrate-binding protein